MKLKFDDNGAVVTIEKEGIHFPIYVDDDGKELGTVDEMVIEMLAAIESDHIDSELLAKIYQDL